MDRLKQISHQLNGRILSQILFDSNFKGKSLRKLVAKDHRGYKIEIDEFGDIFYIKIKVYSNYNLSINNPNSVSSIDQQIDFESSSLKLYIFNESYQSFIKGFRYNPFYDKQFRVYWPSLMIVVNNLHLEQDETVSIRENYIGFALHSNRELISIINSIVDTLDNHGVIFRKNNPKKIQTKNIPAGLQFLSPFLKKWSIPDDNERSLVIDDMNDKERKKLIDAVYPHMPEINKYLDSFNDGPLSEEAILIENLAELVSEIKIAGNK